MSVTAFAFGNTTPTVGTETFLPDANGINVAGSFTFHTSTHNMVSGDVLEIRLYQKIVTGGTSRVAYFARYTDAQPTDDLVKISVPISNDFTENNALQVSITQTYGTARAFPWKILRYA